MTEQAIEKKTETEQEKNWALAQRRAQCWASSDLVPTQYQGKVANVIIAMEIANQINISPLAVMQNLYIVHGRPAFEAKFLIATVNASKKYSPLRYRFEGTPGELSHGCRAVAIDLKTDEELIGPLITLQLARDEGWDKPGFNRKTKEEIPSKWVTMSELMLRYRSAAWWCRVYAPEISLGFQTTDEVIDVGPAQVVEVEPGKSSLDAVTQAIKEKQEGKQEPEKAESKRDFLQVLLTQRYGEKADAILDELLMVREKTREDLDEELAAEMIKELEGPEEGMTKRT
jgi:hypothetical protein